jgi:transposase
VDHQPGPGVRPEKSARDRLIRVAMAHPRWALGFEDEVWWSRQARPALHAWAPDDRPLRLVAQTVAKADPDPKALACYGVLLRWWDRGPYRAPHEEAWLRFVDGRPVSRVTAQFLAWACTKLAAAGKRALLLVWDNAAWHRSKEVRGWIRAHNRRVRASRHGVRLVPCLLPVKSPWLNPIEPKWVHAKRKVVEPTRLLPARELAERVCAVFDCPYEPHLAVPKEAA